MKKVYTQIFTAIASCLFTVHAEAQTQVTIPASNSGGTGANTTIHRKPLGSNRAYERTAMKYTHTEIGMMGNITSIGFYCDTVDNPGNTLVKVYIKEVPDSGFTASTVAAEESGATLVYDDTLFSTAFVKDSFITIGFTAPFLHGTTNNIEIIVETNSGGTTGSDLTALSKGFRYSILSNSRMQYWQSGNGSGAVPTGNGNISTNRPNIQLTIAPAAACTAPPTAGITLSNASSICSGSNALLSLLGNSGGIGMTYQWIESSDSLTWTDISGASQSTLTIAVNAVTYYACVLTCSAMSDTSAAIKIILNSFTQCYCTQSIGGGCATSAIDSIGISGTSLANGPTGCGLNNFTLYPASGNTTADLSQGQSYTLTSKYTGNVRAGIWIDYNQNGVYDASEWTEITTNVAANTLVSALVTIPSTALIGQTGMRIRSRVFNGVMDSTSACAAFGTGETEDYIVNITPGVACVAPPTAGTANASASSACAGSVVGLSLTGNTSGTGMSYQWISSTDGLSWNPIVGATSPAHNETIVSSINYACVLTCSGITDTSSSVSVLLNPYYQCYCTQGIGGGCNGTAIDSVGIAGTTLANGPTGCALTNYTAYAAAANTTADLTQGQIYFLTTKYTGNVRAGVWIDYDQNGVYDNTEWHQITATAVANTPITISILIPSGAQTGLTGMRIRTRSVQGALDSTMACAAFGSGETEDYVLNIVAALPCVAPPTAGTTVVSSSSACSGNVVGLSLTGNTSGSGMTYQWLSSPDGLTWSAISGATQSIYAATIQAAGSYCCVLTCSGMSDTSSAVSVTLNPFYQCYCTQNIGGGCNGAAIDSVGIAGTSLANGATGCAANNYAAYPASGATTATLMQGQFYNLTTKYTGNIRAGVWIDYNQNGTFDTNEYQQITTSAVANSPINIPLQIPVSATPGLTGMRIRTRSVQGGLDSTNACTTFGSGETEDYVVTIAGGLPCATPPSAGAALASVGSACPGNSVDLTLSGSTLGIGLSYQWIESANGTTWSAIAGATLPFYSDTIQTAISYACIVTCSGSSDTSSTANVVLNAYYNCYCTQNIGGGCGTTAVDSVGISNTSIANGATGCATNNYINYPVSSTTSDTLYLGFNYNLTAKFTGALRAGCWIDYDHNGQFDATEYFQICTTATANADVTVPFTIPLTALTGPTGMRIRTRAVQGTLDSTNACATFGTGETEDYLIHLDFFVGVNQVKQAAALSVFPNPSKGLFTVSGAVSSSKLTVQVMNNTGELVYSEQSGIMQGSVNKTIDLSALAKGIYFVRLVSDNEISVRKISLQ